MDIDRFIDNCENLKIGNEGIFKKFKAGISKMYHKNDLSEEDGKFGNKVAADIAKAIRSVSIPNNIYKIDRANLDVYPERKYIVLDNEKYIAIMCNYTHSAEYAFRDFANVVEILNDATRNVARNKNSDDLDVLKAIAISETTDKREMQRLYLKIASYVLLREAVKEAARGTGYALTDSDMYEKNNLCITGNIEFYIKAIAVPEEN